MSDVRKGWAPSATAVVVVLVGASILALTLVLDDVVGHSGPLYIAGGVAILLCPGVAAWRKRALRPFGVEVVTALAFYLSMYHAPLRRILSGEGPLRLVEVDVLSLALWASLGVTAAVSLRPGAFSRSAALPPPIPRATVRQVRIEAYAGVAATLIGFGLLVVWVQSVGIGRLLSAGYAEIYLYTTDQPAAMYQGPFTVVGISTLARAIARWPGAGASTRLRAVFMAFCLTFIAATARLGMRGPIIEMLVAVYLLTYETERPVSRQTFLATATLIALLFFFITAMRSRLGEGLASTSVEDVAFQAEDNMTGRAATDFDAVFDNHVMIVEMTRNGLPMLEGRSYAELPVMMLPRQIVGEKPMPLSYWWMRQIDPVGASKGGGRCFGSFAEGYLNFGAPGAVGQVIVVTVLLIALFPLLRAKPLGLSAAAAALLAHSYHCHRVELAAVLAQMRNMLVVAVVTMVVGWLIANVLMPAQTGAPVSRIGGRPRRASHVNPRSRPLGSS